MARVDVVMPKMGESVMEGTVLEWKLAVGDAVEQDETLLEISTDKVDSEVPSPEAGTLVEILVQEGDTVEVGTPIAIIETDADAAATTPAPAAEPASAAASAPEPVDAEATPAAAPEPLAKEAAPVMHAVGTPDPTEAPVDEAPAPEAPSGDGAAPAAGGARVNVVMPKMGESVMEGTVLTWSKAVGDTVEQDETLLEISTDKVDSEVPSPEAGTLVEILVQEGDTVEVGTPIAVIATGAGADAAAPASPSAPAAAPSASAPAPEEKGYGFAGQAVEAVDSGQAPLAQAEEPSGDGAEGPIPRRDDAGNFYSPLVRSIAETEGLTLADLQAISGSGTDGRVTKADVLSVLEQRSAAKAPSAPSVPTPVAPSPAAPASPAPKAPAPKAPAPKPAAPASSGDRASDRVEVIEMDRMRQLIAEHMRRSKDTSAHVTSFAEVDMTGIVRHREAHKEAFQKREGTKLTYTPYFLLAAIEPLRTHPLLNSSVEGSRILIKKDYHIGIAVAIGTKGLLVPVVRNAGQQNLTGLAHTIADLAERTRTKKLQPDELQGGTFTLTNVGSLGSLMGTPIINQPQTAIVSPGAIVKRPVVIEVDGEDAIVVRHMMYVSLSYDHRIIDGSMAASFLRAYRESLEAITVESTLF